MSKAHRLPICLNFKNFDKKAGRTCMGVKMGSHLRFSNYSGQAR